MIRVCSILILLILVGSSVAKASEKDKDQNCGLVIAEKNWLTKPRRQGAISRLAKARDVIRHFGFVFDKAFVEVQLVKKYAAPFEFHDLLSTKELAMNEVGTLQIGIPIAVLTGQRRMVFGYVSSASPLKIVVMKFQESPNADKSWEVQAQEWLKSPEETTPKKAYAIEIDLSRVKDIRVGDEYRYVIDKNYALAIPAHNSHGRHDFPYYVKWFNHSYAGTSSRELEGLVLENEEYDGSSYRSQYSSIEIPGFENLEIGKYCTFKIKNGRFIVGTLLAFNPPTLAMPDYEHKGKLHIVKIDPKKIERAGLGVRPSVALMDLKPGDKVLIETEISQYGVTKTQYPVITLLEDPILGIKPDLSRLNLKETILFRVGDSKVRKYDTSTDLEEGVVHKTIDTYVAGGSYKVKEHPKSGLQLERQDRESASDWEVTMHTSMDFSGAIFSLKGVRTPLKPVETASTVSRVQMESTFALKGLQMTQEQMLLLALGLEQAVEKANVNKEEFRFEYKVVMITRLPETYEFSVTSSNKRWLQDVIEKQLAKIYLH